MRSSSRALPWPSIGFGAFLSLAAVSAAVAQSTVPVAAPFLGPITRVNVSATGVQALGGASNYPAISADGRYVTYHSDATNLLPGYHGIFRHDRLTGATLCLDVSTTGGPGGCCTSSSSISADGRWIAFSSSETTLIASDTNKKEDVFVRDILFGTTTRVSVSSTNVQANGSSIGASISPDGRYVVFRSDATNLVPGDTNGKWDVFLHDRQTKITQRVSISSIGDEGTEDSLGGVVDLLGRHVVFSGPTGLGGNGWMFIRDVQAGTTTGLGHGYNPVISADGRFVAYSDTADSIPLSDVNGLSDIFIRDLQTGLTEIVSVSSQGQPGDGASLFPAISSDGRYVLFSSDATTFEAGKNGGLFVRDVLTGITRWVAHSGGLTAISGDGRTVAFYDIVGDLVPDDTNGMLDVFTRDILVPPSAGSWVVLAGGTYGSHGKPALSASGTLQSGTQVSLGVGNTPPSAGALLIASNGWLALPFGTGMLWPQLTIVVPFATNAAGSALFTLPFPALPAATSVQVQVAVADSTAAGGKGFTLTNAAWGVSQ